MYKSISSMIIPSGKDPFSGTSNVLGEKVILTALFQPGCSLLLICSFCSQDSATLEQSTIVHTRITLKRLTHSTLRQCSPLLCSNPLLGKHTTKLNSPGQSGNICPLNSPGSAGQIMTITKMVTAVDIRST